MRASRPSLRAKQIAEGLIRTGRAASVAEHPDFLLVTGTGAQYWVSMNGAQVFKGDLPHRGNKIQRGFCDAMARAGSDGERRDGDVVIPGPPFAAD